MVRQRYAQLAVSVACLHVSHMRPIPKPDVSRVQHVANLTLTCLASSGVAKRVYLASSCRSLLMSDFLLAAFC